MSLLTQGRFFVPGPTEVRPDVAQAMLRPMIPHRSRAFESLYETTQVGLREVFGTTRPVLVSASSATGLMESALRCAPPGEVLVLVNGAFSARFADIARGCGRTVDTIEVPFGEIVPLDRVEAALAAKPYVAVTATHCETSTGARSNVRAITELARRWGAFCLIDSVSGVGGSPLLFDTWDLDFVLTGSQKSLALPPGLAFAVTSERYLDAARSAPARGRYLDVVELHDWSVRNQTPATPALSLFYALEVQLEAIRSEGMAARWARHAEMAALVVDWVAGAEARTGHRLGILAGEGQRAETVTAVTVSAELRGWEIVAGGVRRGTTMGEGYGPLRDGTFRVGHMGDHSVAGLTAALAVVDEALREAPQHPPA